MTMVDAPSDAETDAAAREPADGGSPPPAANQQPEPSTERQIPVGAPAKGRISLARRVASTALLILSASLLGFGGYLGLLSGLHYDRAQLIAYADFRITLAQGVAPVGPTKTDNPNTLLELGTPVAVLEIPRISQKTVVFEGTTGGVMESGPGHLRSTVLPGQAGISEIMGRAAAYGGPFGQLWQLHRGDHIKATTGQGVSEYRVINVRRAGDRQSPPLVSGKGRLTLVTADGLPFLPSGTLRVDADLVSDIQPTPSTVLTTNRLPSSERVLAIDSIAWLPVVLWGFALVLTAGGITWARSHWGRWQIWIVAVPVITYLGLSVADDVGRLLLNLT